MKPSKIIVTSVVILAIISSALAFTAKKERKFCYSLYQNFNCVVSSSVKIVSSGGTKYYYRIDWDGDQITCTGNSVCDIEARFIAD